MPIINKPFEHFNVVTYTGNGASRTISGVGFQPDFVWIKSRSAVGGNRLFDAVRGATKALYSNLTNAEATESDSLTAFTSDGFSLGADTVGGGVNLNGVTYVAWCWKSSNTTPVSNTAGSITSTVSANTSAGFSVVTWSATSVAGTVGHGLGVAPSMVIFKDRSNGASGYGWFTYHKSVGAGKYLALNGTIVATTNSTVFSTAPTSTVFDPGTGVTTGNGFGNQVAYCFAEVAGYSKFGSYVGNASTDGTFVYTGFRPKYVLVKNTTSAVEWEVYDSTRNPSNGVNLGLIPNQSDAEGTYSPPRFDFLSNGFKLRTSGGGVNGSGNTIIYAAFAEVPTKFALAR